ncbi:unnamed protein product [marine sediment metagenome]|uniref:Uncharacterized protein n=1 Tax=marine sediment metagenome TaxID=412755 RepID=X1ESD3_9ZZZZ
MIILLEECYTEEGKYTGKVVISEEKLTPEFLKKIKEDKENKMGWKKYHGVLDRKIRKKWRSLKVEQHGHSI